jgi:hypothetical protein
MLGLAVGYHFQNANTYRRDWSTQKTFFWQLAWRVPAMEPGTTLLVNELPMQHYSDNSLTAPLNWAYAPDNHSQQMSYMLFFPERRLGMGLPALVEGITIKKDYLAAVFEGNTSRAVTVLFAPPGCLRVLDPSLDSLNSMVPPLMRDATPLSRLDLIQSGSGGQTVKLPDIIASPEPAHGWCYYFEKADLARQLGDWETVASLAEKAFATHEYPNDPVERVPFIEGYAHTGEWQRALDLSRDMLHITPAMKPVLCQLWQRIDQSTPSGSDKDSAMQAAWKEAGCVNTH